MKTKNQKSSRWTSAELEILYAAKRVKWSSKRIAKKLGRSEQAINQKIWKLSKKGLDGFEPYPKAAKKEAKVPVYRAKHHAKPKATESNSRTKDLFIVSATSSLAGGIIGAALYALLSV